MALRYPPWLFRLRLNFWPPFLGAGIRVRRIAADFREIVVEMPLRFYNRGYHGTHFGGSLYAMTDPFFALMVIRNLPHDYVVWDRAASIDFISPGRSRMRAAFALTQEDVDRIVERTAGGEDRLRGLLSSAEVARRTGADTNGLRPAETFAEIELAVHEGVLP